LKTIKTTKNFRYLNEDRKDNVRGTVLEGGSRCFYALQEVVTKNGAKPIKDINKNDIVLSYNESTKKEEFKKVIDTHCFKNNKPTIQINLKNGQKIIATEDHEIFYKGGWVSIKHFVSLFDENMEKNTKL